MEVTIGGQRLGSGNKRTEELHNYNRATFNQEQDWKSSMAPGVLYPFLCIPMTNGDSMDIDLDSFVRTLPTKGPLFGSFKLQCDIFSVPMRLYNGILHNNPIDIGLKMKDIYFPKLLLEYDPTAAKVVGNSNFYTWQVHPTSLLKYLGLSGVGLGKTITAGAARKINAIPVLAYYDIFKNYYANKQEEEAYIITPINLTNSTIINYIEVYNKKYDDEDQLEENGIPLSMYDMERWNIDIYGKNLNTLNINIELITRDPEGSDITETLEDSIGNGYIMSISESPEKIRIKIPNNIASEYSTLKMTASGRSDGYVSADIGLKPFKLKNIDNMREAILASASQGLGYEFMIGDGGDWGKSSGEDGTGLPYKTLFDTVKIPGDPAIYLNTNYNSFPMNGLMVKTYQSDLFNNWIQTDWIEGENGIAALSAVSVSEGSFQIDALNIAEKVYNMLNRIALSGGTYEDWQEAVYTQDSVRKAETPIYEGGMAAEVVFEEVISSAETQVEDDIAALGTLGGKGTMIGQRGGKNIHIKAREPIFVMGIVSLTPRICYTQGNEWYLTDLNSYDDLHKPALDQIGFQDLLVEQFAWWDAKANGVIPGGDDPYTFTRSSAGKVVAWSNYMTAVDKAFGDFAMPEGKGFMVLARNYTRGANREVQDVTTYIDPAKFNYAFAYNDLKAQNFWVQIHSKVITRRVMSAHQIPNL